MAKIIKRGNKWIATDGEIKIETHTTYRGFPVFPSSVALYKLFPNVESEISDFLLSNHIRHASPQFSKCGACWYPTTVSSGDGNYPSTHHGGKKWGVYLEDELYTMSYNIFRGLDVVVGQLHHICLQKACIRPEHLEDETKSNHRHIHFSMLEDIPEDELRNKKAGKRKITNRMAIGLRYLHKKFGVPVRFLSFFLNTSERTIRQVINEKSHIITDEGIQNEFNDAVGIKKPSIWNDLRTEILIHLYNSKHHGILKRYARALGVPKECVYQKIYHLKKTGNL